MPFTKENRINTFTGILFVAGFALLSTILANIDFFRQNGISPLIIGIVLGVIYGNTLRHRLPIPMAKGIVFSSKTLLRIAIVIYGFRITFGEIYDIGLLGVMSAILMLATTFIIGSWAGMKILGLDRDTSMLTASGASVCGAAAVLATEPVLKSEPHKTAIAVATVVMFGTIAMFLYPVFYKAGVFVGMSEENFGIYVGATIHEVAQVVAVGNAISEDAAHSSVIVKMTRVMLIAPLLIAIGYYLVMSTKNTQASSQGKKLVLPWFAVGFIVVAGFNSFHLLPSELVKNINDFDTFLLTMAMSALGMETLTSKFKGAGLKPIYLALIMFIWLMVGGYFIIMGLDYIL